MPDVDQLHGPRRLALFAVVAVLILAADAATKSAVVANLQDPGQQPVRVLGGVLYLNLTRNSGAAFSMGTGFTAVLTVVALAVVAVIIRTARRLRSVAWAVSLGLILGGAVGNLSDRLLRAPGVGRGHVVDFVSLFGPYDKYWPVFNVADSAICVGAALAALQALRGINFDGTSERRAARG